MNGFELFNYGNNSCARGTEEGVIYLSYGMMIKKGGQGLGPWQDAERKYRVMWDGIACWPYLAAHKVLKYGINMVSSTYPDSVYSL